MTSRLVRGGRRWLLVAVATLAGCSQGSDDAALEVAAELRALRLAMQATRPEPVVDQEQFGAALSPLREVLDRLVAEQKELHARQLALTGELQRWSQLLVQQVTGPARSESEALTARLQQLEDALKAQDARHREVEALLGGALDRTADRLDDFLQRLQGRASQPSEPPASRPKTEGGAVEAKDPAPEPKGAVGDGARARRQAANAWWIAVLSAAALVGLGCAWRLRRSAAAELAPPAVEPVPDRGVEEIWAAAAMLGEAVGRLRDSANAEGQEPNGAPAAGDGDLLDDGEFVLDDGDLVLDDDAGGSTVAAPAAASPPQPTAVDLHVRATARPGALDAVRKVLGEDPRVLRRPAPEVVVSGDGLHVHFAVLPTLPAGQRAHVAQRVRDAAG